MSALSLSFRDKDRLRDRESLTKKNTLVCSTQILPSIYDVIRRSCLNALAASKCEKTITFKQMHPKFTTWPYKVSNIKDNSRNYKCDLSVFNK